MGMIFLCFIYTQHNFHLCRITASRVSDPHLSLAFFTVYVTFATLVLYHFLSCRLCDTYTEVCSTALLTRALPLALYTLLVTLMRYHLFVWTVFSPKLLYEGMLTLVMSGFCGACLLMANTLKRTKQS